MGEMKSRCKVYGNRLLRMTFVLVVLLYAFPTYSEDTTFADVRSKAEQGNAVAQHNLGLLYAQGSGVDQDYIEAMKWWHKSADQGYAPAQTDLGLMYAGSIFFWGKGGRIEIKDYTMALKYFRYAANQGDAKAQFNLGQFYENGQGVTRDDMEAYMWYSLAIAGDFPEATAPMHAIKSRMTSEQIEQAQKRVSAWKPTPFVTTAHATSSP